MSKHAFKKYNAEWKTGGGRYAAGASVSIREMRFQTGTIITSACGIVGTLAEEARVTTELAEGKAGSVVFLGSTSRPEANTTTVS